MGRFPRGERIISCAARLLQEVGGSALLEFAIVLPLLVVFVVGIFDFSGAFNQKQKIDQAAQEGAIIAGAQPMSDIQPTTTNPTSLLPVVSTVFNSLLASGVLPQGTTCAAPGVISGPGTTPGTTLTWTYTISGCTTIAGDQLIITINRGCVCGGSCAPTCTSGPPVSVGTVVTVQYPYHWRFNSVIQLLAPGANYAALTQLSESATVHNQI